MFDVNRMMSTVFEDANSTQSIPCPEGEYTAVIEKIDLRTVNTKDGERAVLRLVCSIQDNDGRVKAITGRDKTSVNYDVWLDTTPEGNLDMCKGMNVGLGKLRDAFGQNTPGKAWGFGMLVGNAAKVLITHRQTEQGPFADVKTLTAL